MPLQRKTNGRARKRIDRAGILEGTRGHTPDAGKDVWPKWVMFDTGINGGVGIYCDQDEFELDNGSDAGS